MVLYFCFNINMKFISGGHLGVGKDVNLVLGVRVPEFDLESP